MSLNDPISDLLTIIRNGVQAGKETIDIPASKLNGRILEIFKNDGYIEDVRLMKNNTQGTFKVYLKYENKKSAIIGLRRISSAACGSTARTMNFHAFLTVWERLCSRPQRGSFRTAKPEN